MDSRSDAIGREVRSDMNDASAQRGFAVALNSLSDGLALFDASGFLVYCNSQCSNIFPNASDVWLPGRSAHDIMCGAVRRGAIRTGHPCAEQTEATPAQRLHDLDGREFELVNGRWIVWRMKFADDGDCLLILNDVTERKQASRLLENSEERYRSVVEYGYTRPQV